MKKALLICFIIGLLCFIVGGVGTYYYTFVDNQYEENQQKQHTFDDQNIKQLDINAKNIDLTIRKGDQLTYTADFEKDGVTLNHDSKSGKAQINMNNNNENKPEINLNPVRPLEKNRLVVEIPEQLLSQLKINGTRVNALVEDMSVKQLNTTLIDSNIMLNDSSIDELSGQIENGNYELSDVQLKQVKMKNKWGYIDISGIHNDIPMTLDNQNGTIYMEYNPTLSNTKFNVTNQEGTVDLDGVEELDEMSHKVGNGENEVTINNKKGDITIISGIEG